MDGEKSTNQAVGPSQGARPRVIFVDDEPNVLAGLKLLLREQRKDWDMVFAGSGAEALTMFETATFDVVVTDMRMPHMDGVSLLEEVKNKYPGTVRIVLSGQTEQSAIMRTVFLTHRFLAKPCSAEAMRILVSRLVAHHARMRDPMIAKTLGGIGFLPAAPSSLIALTAAMARPNSCTQDVAAVVEGDPSLCSKILQLVNSSFFGLARRVSTATEAVTLLGLTNVRSVTLAVEAMNAFKTTSREKQKALEEIRSHSEATAAVAAAIAKRVGLSPQEAYTLGILHDIGHLVLLSTEAPEALSIEPELAGAYLLAVWGLPLSMGEAVAYHHAPAQLEHVGIELLDVVHAANHLASAFLPNPIEKSQPLDLSYLEKHGVTATEFKKWEELAATALGKGKDA